MYSLQYLLDCFIEITAFFAKVIHTILVLLHRPDEVVKVEDSTDRSILIHATLNIPYAPRIRVSDNGDRGLGIGG